MKFFRVNKVINEGMLLNFKEFMTKQEELKPEFICLIFDSPGGNLYYSRKIIDLMNKSSVKFIGLAYKSVDSAAIPIFLSTSVRYGHKSASALIHKVKPDPNSPVVSEKRLRVVERQIFRMIAEKTQTTLENICLLANDGIGTYITMDHSLGKKFFIGS